MIHKRLVQRLSLLGRIVLLLIFSVVLFSAVPSHARPTTTIDIQPDQPQPRQDQWITYTAFVTCSEALPTGAITFVVDNVEIPQVEIEDGIAPLGLSLDPGSHLVTAKYAGDDQCGAGQNSIDQSVLGASKTMSVTSSANPSAVGQAVTFTATVYCDQGPSGNITFTDGSSVLGSVSPAPAGVNTITASFTTSTLLEGSHNIVASIGDTNGCGKSAGLVQAVGTNAITWCDLSSDGRINAKCGDRIVVYCNAKAKPANIDVWIVDNDSKGHELTMILLETFPGLPKGQYIKAMGSSGVFFAGMDANGNGYVALQGGPYGATAKGDWAKEFTCKASA
jgi:hypothetical protein